jgi:TusA-related sulfurtransferase
MSGTDLETYKAMEKMLPNQLLRIEASDFGFYSDVSKWAEKTGNTVVDLKMDGKKVLATLKKGQEKSFITAKRIPRERNHRPVLRRTGQSIGRHGHC